MLIEQERDWFLGSVAVTRYLPAGSLTSSQAPSQKTVQVFSLAQPTTVNIDCT